MTLTDADTGAVHHAAYAGTTRVLWISSQAALDALAARVAGCTTDDGGGGWAIESGGLRITFCPDVTDLEPLRHLVAIRGEDSGGWSLTVSVNAKLASLRGLRGLRVRLGG